ncbi:hypothetical protein GDO78_019703 [Eleutherodactylus coqui]|uniref:Uncharacterized protein n=1 Tax=Eleutherodactylus coqui TaxID=57060 RepID=A0A8J6B9G0_ELECQ|nr:hypothetical protein GDO78_019703 [Eleutherodactylus coqui]
MTNHDTAELPRVHMDFWGKTVNPLRPNHRDVRGLQKQATSRPLGPLHFSTSVVRILHFDHCKKCLLVPQLPERTKCSIQH